MRASEFINEVKMSPGVFKRFASSPEASDVLVGFEAELVFSGWGVDPDEAREPDYSDDEIIFDIDDLRRWCNYHDDLDSSQLIRDAIDALEQEYNDWVESKIDRRKENLKHNFRDFRKDEWKQTDHTNLIREKLKEEGYESDEVDTFIENQTSEYESALSELQDEYDSNTEYDIRNESGNFEDYLNDNLDDTSNLEFIDFAQSSGVVHVSDFYENAGLEWPLYSVSGEEYEYNQYEAERLADELSDALGVTVEAIETAREKKLDRWYIESDPSIEPDKNDPVEMPVEIVSPPMPLKTALSTMREFFAWARANGAYANESTGFHVSVSLPNYQNIDYVKLVLFLGDEYVLDGFDRRNNTYTQSALEILRDNAENMTPELLRAIFEKMKSGSNQLASAMIAMRNPEKYVSVNLKEDYVEFRGGGNSAYIDSSEIAMVSQIIMRYAYALTIACDENMYKKEYMTKLAKLLSPESVGGKSIVSAFVQYSVDKDLSALRDATQELKQEKSTPDEFKKYMIFVYEYMTNLILSIKRRVNDTRILKYEKILNDLQRDSNWKLAANKEVFDAKYIGNFLYSLAGDGMIDRDQIPVIVKDIEQKFGNQK